MSYILDALRRSEQERRRADISGGLVAVDQEPSAGRRWLPWVLTVALAANAAVLGWLLLPAANEPVAPPPGPARSAVVVAPTPAPLPALADVAGQPNALPPAPVASPAVVAPRSLPVRAETTPTAPLPAPATQTVVGQTQPAAMPANEPGAPLLSAMPADFRQAVPAIGVSVHVYAEQPAARWVLIEGRRVQEGQEAAAGVRLERITPNGLVLSFRGQRFLMDVR